MEEKATTVILDFDQRQEIRCPELGIISRMDCEALDEANLSFYHYSSKPTVI